MVKERVRLNSDIVKTELTWGFNLLTLSTVNLRVKETDGEVE